MVYSLKGEEKNTYYPLPAANRPFVGAGTNELVITLLRNWLLWTLSLTTKCKAQKNVKIVIEG